MPPTTGPATGRRGRAPQAVAVLGAGPAGLAAALLLARAGVPVDVFEGAAVPGGLARSLPFAGGAWPLGPHVFAPPTPEVGALYRALAGPDVDDVPVRRAVLVDGARVPYPPGPLALWRALPPRRAAACTAGFLTAARARTTAPGSAEQELVRAVGRPAYELLVRPYVEKLQGRPPTALDPLLARAFLGEGGRRSAAALVGGLLRPAALTFPEPRDGTGALWQRAVEQVRAAGGRVHLGDAVEAVRQERGRVVGVRTGSGEHPVDAVLSTLPLPVLLRALDLPSPSGPLQARSTVLVHLLVPLRAPRQEELWVALHDPALRTGRVSDLGHVRRSDAPAGTTVLCAELWCDPDDPLLARTDAALVDLVQDELAGCGLLPGRALDAHVLRLARTHPVFAPGTGAALTAAEAALDAVGGLARAGRGATHSLGTVGGSAAAGLAAARDLLGLPIARGSRALEEVGR